MPVSHLGLTVSHIPSATSFYLAALQPLGYRYIGHQGDSIGLGVDSADFFLTQSPIGTRPSPNHIAFLAESRLIVRECYASALNSGGLPTGSPNYRNDDCSCFNAAVEDLDGNTIEFIFRQPHGQGACCGSVAPSEGSRVLTWQKDVAESAAQDDDQSVAKSMVSRSSKTSKSKSRMQTALDLASTTSKSFKPETPAEGTARSFTAPEKSDFPGKAIIGTALGAAAGAALMYALTRAESENAKEEADHIAYMATKSREPADEVVPPAPRAETLPPSVAPAPVPAPSRAPKSEKRFHRNFSVTESAFSRRPQPPETRAMRMLEATGHNREDDDVQEVMSRYDHMRANPTRIREDEVIDYAPSRAARSEAPSGHSIRRAHTLPAEDIDRQDYYLEAPPPKSHVSRHSSRHDDTPRSTVSHSTRHDHPPRSSVSHSSRHSKHRRSSYDDEKLKRHDSGTSVHSSRSRREREGDAERRSSAGTIKPLRRDSVYEQIAAAAAAAAIPENVSQAGSKAPDSCYFPAAISLPPSHVSSKVTAVERERSNAGIRQVVPKEPLDPVASKQSWEDFVAEESDGMGDIKTVVPDDSISCVDLSSRPRRSSHSHHHHRSSRHSHHSSRRSETSDRTVRPAKTGGSKHTVVLPHRSKRSTVSYA